VTPPSDVDAVDFKPFFDMVVGVLFVLLILIAAQMFFVRWAGSPDELSAREKEEQADLARKTQVSKFLEDLAIHLRQNGLVVTVDRVNQAILLPLGSLADPTRDVSVQSSEASRLSEVLTGRLRCLPGQAGPKPGDCPTVNALQLGGLLVEVRVGQVPVGIRLPPDRYALLLSTRLGGLLLRDSSELLAITGSGGAPALQVKSSVFAAPGSEPVGDILIRFSFEL